jgi:3-deoxy-7-phosphoheptulonate synthase
VHPDPDAALCDGPQALVEEDMPELARAIGDLSVYMGRRSPVAPLRRAG